MATITRFTLSTSTTQHYGAVINGEPRLICGTTSYTGTFVPVPEGTYISRMCQTCERGYWLVLRRVVRPEVRLLAGAKSSAAGHYLIPHDEVRVAYCGKTVGNESPAGDRMCKNCETMRGKVATFTQEFDAECAGYAVAPEQPIVCDCGWMGRYASHTDAAGAEWDAHEGTLPVDNIEAELAAAVDAAVEPAVDEWLGATVGQQLTLAGMRPDAQQGLLFA